MKNSSLKVVLDKDYEGSTRFFPSWDQMSVKQIHGLMSLIQHVKELTPSNSTWVEIGSHHGESATIMLGFDFIKKLYCVDPWQSKYFQARLQSELDSKRCEFFKMTSLEASKLIQNPHVVYIDGAHDYENVALDIKTWYDKLPQGGVLCGHDYYIKTAWPGVCKAVNEFAHNHNKQIVTYADSSWMFVK